jgi:hypothetical protein
LFLLFTRCTIKEDYIFEESATARIKAYVTACEAVITKPEHGWKVLFEPNKESLGGFNVVMKFNEDGTVRMICDFLDEESTSSYSFNESQGAVLHGYILRPALPLRPESPARRDKRRRVRG